MKIVALDGYALNPGDISWAEIQALGELKVYDRTPPEKVARRIGEAQIVLSARTPITGKVMADCPALRYIGVLATGYDAVDVGKARERGITVTNVPYYGTEAVAQFAFAHLFELTHPVSLHAEAVRLGQWVRDPDWTFRLTPMYELNGKTMGVIGLGRIGREVARIAQGFGMSVLAQDKVPDPSLESPTLRYASLDNLLQNSDFVVLCCPLLPDTRHLICRESIEKMKDGAFLINISRGQLVAEQDLAEALNSGKLAGAGLDVLSQEPPESMDSPLFYARNCHITPHIAWGPIESRRRLMTMAAENIYAFLEGKPQNVVNG